MVKDIIKLDLHKQSAYPTIFAKQYDTLEREITIELYNDDVPYTLQGTAGNDYIIMLRYTKPDGKQGLLDYSVDSRGIHACLTDQVLCSDGRIICDIGIYRNKTTNGASVNSLLSSSIFYIQVGKSAFDETQVVSSNEYLALTTAINNCIRITDECKKIITEYTNTIKPEMQALINRMKEHLDSVNR